MNKELKNLAIWGGSFLGFVGMLGIVTGLAGCTFDQAEPYVAAGCAAGQIAAATASMNAAALNKPKVAGYISQGQQLAASDCTAAMAMIAAAKAAAAAPPSTTASASK